MNNIPDKIVKLNQSFEALEPPEILEWACQQFEGGLMLACSLGPEDTALLDMLCRIQSNPRVFFLDTGRLHEQSYELMNSCRNRYQIEFEVYSPDQKKVAELLSRKGPYSFYESVENRKQCCQIRKVEGLQRALKNAQAWITGLRRNQSELRAATPILEIDQSHDQILKINPLARWSFADVIQYHKENKIPYHPLIEQGYVSIGCEPCTRAIAEGEAFRAGRWWWEDSQKECGLHLSHS